MLFTKVNVLNWNIMLLLFGVSLVWEEWGGDQTEGGVTVRVFLLLPFFIKTSTIIYIYSTCTIITIHLHNQYNHHFGCRNVFNLYFLQDTTQVKSATFDKRAKQNSSHQEQTHTRTQDCIETVLWWLVGFCFFPQQTQGGEEQHKNGCNLKELKTKQKGTTTTTTKMKVCPLFLGLQYPWI